MLRLARELAEMPCDPQLRTTHMLENLCGIVGAKGSTSFFARHNFVKRRRKITVLSGLSTGLEDKASQEVLMHYMQTMLPTDPLGEPLYSAPGRQVTMGREQMMNRNQWHDSAHFNEVRRGIGIDDCVATRIVLGRGNHVLTFCLHRASADRPFTRRQWEVLDLFHSEMYRLLDVRSARPMEDLSPRTRQVLQCILAGDSAKQIAAKLNLSVYTVQDYIKALYERFNVSGRGELLACFTNPGAQNEDERALAISRALGVSARLICYVMIALVCSFSPRSPTFSIPSKPGIRSLKSVL
jgi:DNA-binding CsgD family transcriptional regulator